MYKSALLILNPYAGKRKPPNDILNAINEIKKTGCSLDVYTTRSKKDTILTVQNTARDYDLVICCGGDGTLNEVVYGMKNFSERPPLGYIPCGTTNDIASSLNLSKSPVCAAKDIISGSPFCYDLGFLNDQVFLYIAAFGIFSGVSYTTPQNLKNMLGRPAYFLESIKELANIKSYHLKIQYSGKTIEDDFIFGCVSNSRRIAGVLKLKNQNVKFDDGLFEVLLVKTPSSMGEFANIIDNLSKQRFKEKNIMFFQASDLNIFSSSKIRWCLDGEDGSLHSNVKITNAQKNIKFIIN